MNNIFAVTMAAALAACFSSPALAQGPRAGTEAALQCLLRQGPPGCQDMFVGRATAPARQWAAANNNRDFRRGPLQSSQFFGQATADNVYDERVLRPQMADVMDIYDVKFAYDDWSVYISPPDADGKIRHLAIQPYAPHDPNQLACSATVSRALCS
jgi:hypothetical protein